MASMKLTEKAVGYANIESYVLVTQKELPSDYVITGNEEEGELEAMKIESVRRIPTDQFVELVQDNLEVDEEPTDESENLIESGGVKTALDGVSDRVTSTQERVSNLEGSQIFKSASGSIASFSDGADNLPLKSCVVNLEPIQAGEGDPSPENIRAISGYSGAVTVYRTGEIVSDYSIENGYYDADGVEQSSDAMKRTPDFIPVEGGTKCLIKVMIVSSTSKMRVHQYNASQQWISEAFETTQRISSDKDDIYVFALDSNARYIRFSLPKFVNFELYRNADDVEVTIPSEAGTVYGGTLDIVSGKLIVRYTSIKLSSRNSWSYDANYSRMLIGLENMIYNKYATRAVPLYCSMAPCVTDGRGFNSVPNNSFYGAGGSSRSVFFQTTDYTTPEQFLAVYGDADLVYELAEPAEYQLTPQEVRTLLGENNILSDSGDVDVNYPADTKSYVDDAVESLTRLDALIDTKAPAIYETVSGPVASIQDGADDMPLKSCVVTISPIQEGTGDPSPENICPISGRTELSVYRRGANLIDDSIKNVNSSNTSLYFGGPTNSYVHFLKAGTYTLSCEFSDGVHYGAFIKETNSPQVQIWPSSVANSTDQASFILPSDGFYRMWFYQTQANGGVSVDGVSNIMLNVGDTALPYEPYKQTEPVSVNWESEAGTVYGGTLDLVSGKLTVDKKGVSLNDPSKWSETSAGVFTYALGASDRAIYSDSYYGLICSHYTANYSLPQYCRWSSANSGNFRISDSNATPEGLQALSQSGDLKIVYNLAEPVEYQLTPQEVRTLLGNNNIWSDGGDMTIAYPADTKMYINKKITEAIAAAMA